MMAYRLAWALVLTALSGLLVATPAVAQQELFVLDAGGDVPALSIYSRTASGNTPPIRTLGEGIGLKLSLAVDVTNNELFVGSGNRVSVYGRFASGSAPPLRVLQGAATGLLAPIGLAIDLTHDELIVLNGDASVTVYARTASGNTPPLRTLAVPVTGLSSLSNGLAV